MALADWVDVLRDMPQQAIDAAVSEWLRTQERRPTPAGIRRLAQKRLEPKAPPVPDDDEWPFRNVVVPADELKRRREMCARLAEVYPALRKIQNGEGG